MLVAQIGDEIAGGTIAFIRDGRPHLYGTAVAPEFRTHRGIGSRLVGSQLSNFQKLGYPEIDTIIRCDNSISIKTGEKVGFKHVRTMRNFFSFPRVSARLYVKSLSVGEEVTIRGPRLRDKAKDFWGRVVEPRLNRGLRVAWFDDWHRWITRSELPGWAPARVFRMIMQNPSSTRKRTALVMEGDGPVAVVGLREKGRSWLPAMQGIIPGAIAPARDGYLFPSSALALMQIRPAYTLESTPARNAVPVPMFRIDCRSSSNITA
jgi:hypothetical protein